MGPRTRRRLTAGAISLAAVAAIVVGVLLIARSPHHATQQPSGIGSVRGATGGGGVVVRAGVTANLTYGMTEHEVRARIGKPTKTLRDPNGTNCWQYAENQRFHGLDGSDHTFNAVRVCFVSGQYALDYLEFDGKWNYKPPKITVTS